jgi:hypothetical protein
MEDSYFAFLGSGKRVPEAARISAVVSELAGDNEKSRIRSRVGSSQGSSGALGLNPSSLPSVPSLPMPRTSGVQAVVSGPSGGFGAAALSVPGAAASGSGNRTFSGGSSAGGSRPGGPGSRPGGSLHDSLRSSAVSSAPAFGAGVIDRSGPRGSKMVYVLVAVLIAAIAVLAILLFSGESPRRTGAAQTVPRD